MTVRFGPLSYRGNAIPHDVEARLDEFVQMGFWSREDVQAPRGDRLARYTLTALGDSYLRGNPRNGAGAFCPPAERRLLRIVETVFEPATRHSEPAMFFRRDEVSRLFVRFEWIGSSAPSWLTTPALREKYGPYLPDDDSVAVGAVTLYRVWRRAEHPILDAPNSGALEGFCYDAVHGRPNECWALPMIDARGPPS